MGPTIGISAHQEILHPVSDANRTTSLGTNHGWDENTGNCEKIWCQSRWSLWLQNEDSSGAHVEVLGACKCLDVSGGTKVGACLCYLADFSDGTNALAPISAGT